MQATKRRPGIRRGGIIYLSVEDIEPNPVQPRQHFSDSDLHELSMSIAEYGILNPLTVRLRDSRYELVAGERRLRAAKLAGMCDVPCILLDVNMEDASLIALVENIQRRDLDFIEEAIGLNQLIRMFGMSQEEAARRIGKSQSAVANKLRLLKLPRDVLDGLRDNGLTERHGRALLRLQDADSQRMALAYIAANGLTVAAAALQFVRAGGPSIFLGGPLLDNRLVFQNGRWLARTAIMAKRRQAAPGHRCPQLAEKFDAAAWHRSHGPRAAQDSFIRREGEGFFLSVGPQLSWDIMNSPRNLKLFGTGETLLCFTARAEAPETRAARMVSRMEFVRLNTMMVMPVQRTRDEPTERSICPVMMTKAMPSAIVPTMQVFWLPRIATMWLHLKEFPPALTV